MRSPEVSTWFKQCQDERRALDYDPKTRFLDESVREYIESLEEEREKLLEVVDAARVVLNEGREEALDDHGKPYPWEKWLVYWDNEKKLIDALASLEEFYKQEGEMK